MDRQHHLRKMMQKKKKKRKEKMNPRKKQREEKKEEIKRTENEEQKREEKNQTAERKMPSKTTQANKEDANIEQKRLGKNQRQKRKRKDESLESRDHRLHIKRQAKRCKLVDYKTNATQIYTEDSTEEHNCGTLTESCHYCGALYWLDELNSTRKYTKCCHDGKVTLKELNEPPDLLKELLLTQSTEAKNYREHIREYNAALALASMGAEINTPPGRGPYCFRIHGQIYHKVSPLYPSEQHKPGYGQLYIFDTGEATKQRLQNNSACLATVLESLDPLLRNINPFAKSYEQMHRLTESFQTAKVQMIFMEQANLDLRRYNAPSSHTEVAAIFVNIIMPLYRFMVRPHLEYSEHIWSPYLIRDT
ncbi:uncharacterized protein LOC128344287 [Hemicordylus capensis]|uniref:uncharacterized protein LOC128344287 n=1 Tax=Hemicordylus capensis TaxID=884348 RepID=UPI00230497B2|nr:uncharacterized protein LOC128344287 [Hemicordylus capensis]